MIHPALASLFPGVDLAAKPKSEINATIQKAKHLFLRRIKDANFELVVNQTNDLLAERRGMADENIVVKRIEKGSKLFAFCFSITLVVILILHLTGHLPSHSFEPILIALFSLNGVIALLTFTLFQKEVIDALPHNALDENVIKAMNLNNTSGGSSEDRIRRLTERAQFQNTTPFAFGASSPLPPMFPINHYPKWGVGLLITFALLGVFLSFSGIIPSKYLAYALLGTIPFYFLQNYMTKILLDNQMQPFDNEFHIKLKKLLIQYCEVTYWLLPMDDKEAGLAAAQELDRDPPGLGEEVTPT